MAASHVVVIDSTARRATVKTTPNKHLSDILEEACSKLGVSATQYGLKCVRADQTHLQLINIMVGTTTNKLISHARYDWLV